MHSTGELDLFEGFVILKGMRFFGAYWRLKGYDRLFKVAIEWVKILKGLILPVGNNLI
jgi:hypothetical protein